MVQLLNSFNPMEYDPSQGGGSWPLGKHPVIIESAEVKATQDNSSGYLQLNCKIVDGPNAGFSGAYRLNLYNQSAKAAEIAHRQLSAICHVTQTFQLGQDGTQIQFLFNKPFVVEVGMQKGEEAQEKGYTEIKRVFDMGGNEPGKHGTAQQPSQAAQGFGGLPQQGNGNAAAFGSQGASSAPANGQQGGAQAWGGNGAGAQQPQGQQGQGQGASWGQNGGQQPEQQGGGWAQGQGGAPASGGGQPAWGQRN